MVEAIPGFFRCIFSIIWGRGVGRKRQAEIQIEAQYTAFCHALKQGDYALAYTVMSPEYWLRHDRHAFVEAIEHRRLAWGPCSASSRRYIAVSGDKGSLYPGYMSFASLYGGTHLELEKTAGEWAFTGQTDWYSD